MYNGNANKEHEKIIRLFVSFKEHDDSLNRSRVMNEKYSVSTKNCTYMYRMNVVTFAFLIPSLSRVSFAHSQMGYVTYIPTRVVNT